MAGIISSIFGAQGVFIHTASTPGACTRHPPHPRLICPPPGVHPHTPCTMHRVNVMWMMCGLGGLHSVGGVTNWRYTVCSIGGFRKSSCPQILLHGLHLKPRCSSITLIHSSPGLHSGLLRISHTCTSRAPRPPLTCTFPVCPTLQEIRATLQAAVQKPPRNNSNQPKAHRK